MIAYVAGGWSAAFVIIGVYAWRTARRAHRLARLLPPGERTWR